MMIENSAHGTGPENMTPEAFAGLGGGEIAYVRTVSAEQVKAMFPQAPEIAPGMTLFTLHAADGTPIMLTNSREAALANAMQNELVPVSVH